MHERERELKKEWAEVSQVTNSALAKCFTASRDVDREQRESERRVMEWERGRELVWCVCVKWVESRV